MHPIIHLTRPPGTDNYFKPTRAGRGLIHMLAAMKTFLLLFVLASTPAWALSTDSRVSTVPTDLALAETSGPHRLLVFQVCSPEHCWNEFFIQELRNDGILHVACSSAITELNKSSDAVASSAHWLSGATPILELGLLSSHDAFQPYTASLSVQSGCKYKLHHGS